MAYLKSTIVIALFFSLVKVQAQKLDHIQGELLVQIASDVDFNALIKKIQIDKNINGSIQSRQLTTYPFQVHQVKVDFRITNEVELAKAFWRNAEVDAVQKNFNAEFRAIPNDPFFNRQWQHINDGSSGGVEGIDTDADVAWDITTGGLTALGDTIVICVIDDGVDISHVDLVDNLWINHGEIPDNGIDDDNNGYIDDYFGYDTIENDNDVTREGSHGTSVVGIVGAKGNNEIGVAGVNWDTKIMNVRGGSNAANGVLALTYPYLWRKKYNETNGQEGAFVVAINASWGFERKFEIDAPIFCNFFDALGEVGIITSAATTNSNRNVETEGDLPTNCSSDYLIGVTNLLRNGEKRSSAGFGNISIDLAAPGETVYTIARGDNYRNFSGTSGAAPQVAGAIGLMYATPCDALVTLAKDNPLAAATLVKNTILGTVTANPNLTDITFTGGHLNTGNAVMRINELCNSCDDPMDVNINNNMGITSINWRNTSEASSASLRFREKGAVNWNTIENLVTSTTLNNLNACTTYELQLRSNCNPSGAFSPSYYFFADGCCEVPDNVTFNENNDNITVSWSEVFAAQNYTIEYKTVESREWTSEISEANTFVIPGITSCSGYNIRIKSECGNESSVFTITKNIEVSCGTCTSGAYCQDNLLENEFEWISGLKLGKASVSSGPDPSGYGRYLGDPQFTVTQGMTYPIKIGIGYSGGSFSEFGLAYIDWNQNAEFEENELVLPQVEGVDTLEGEITVPINALPGITRMRIIMSFENISAACQIPTLVFGEIEDYCIAVQSMGECIEMPSVDAFTTSLNSITLTVTSATSINNYSIEYRLAGSTDFNQLTSNESVISIENLLECSNYELRVRNECNSGNSPYSDIITVKTRCSTGIDDPDGNIESFEVYPNPVQDQIFVKIGSIKSFADYKVSLIDVTGSIVYRRFYPHNSGDIIIKDTNLLNAGIYLLIVESENAILTEKLVKH